jgi:hypothetical protein
MYLRLLGRIDPSTSYDANPTDYVMRIFFAAGACTWNYAQFKVHIGHVRIIRAHAYVQGCVQGHFDPDCQTRGSSKRVTFCESRVRSALGVIIDLLYVCQSVRG